MKYSRIRKLVIPIALIVLITSPMVLQCSSQLFQKKYDVTLSGYYETYEKPKLTAQSFINGEYQVAYEKWLNNNITTRNMYTKMYNQIQFSLFDLCNRIVGKNNNIFEYGYIRSELCLDGYDYSIHQNNQAMEEYINCLSELNEKLKKIGKNLIVYTTPSKAHWYPDDIPESYKVQTVDGIRGIDSFREKIDHTNIAYIDSDPIVEKCQYPSFYNTGIHWARTVEQETSVEIIKSIKDLTKKNYRDLVLGKVEFKETPYWRDSDVYDLANLILPAEKTRYYQYDIEREMPREFSKLRLLLQGGSFAQGLVNDYFHTYAGEEIYYINYNTSVTYDNGEVYKLESWENLDLQYILDQTDVVAIEMNDHHISGYSDGFAQYLSAYLDSYVPNLSEDRPADANLDPLIGTGLKYNDGYYQFEEGHVWAQKDSSVTLYNSNISEKGLELSFGINENILIDGSNSIYIYINQELLRKIDIDEPGDQHILLEPKELPYSTDGKYDIEIISQKEFNPYLLGLSTDNRNLAIDVYYIGEVR